MGSRWLDALVSGLEARFKALGSGPSAGMARVISVMACTVFPD